MIIILLNIHNKNIIIIVQQHNKKRDYGVVNVRYKSAGIPTYNYPFFKLYYAVIGFLLHFIINVNLFSELVNLNTKKCSKFDRSFFISIVFSLFA